MKPFFTRLFYCSCFILLSFITKAQTKFIATISPSQAGKDEYITLTLAIENGNNVQQISHPDFSDFNVISGPSQSISTTNINGVVSQKVALTYILQAKKTGSFSIGASTALVDGKSIKSNTVKVSVSAKTSTNNQQQNNTSPLAGFDIFDEPVQRKVYDDYIMRKGETVQEKVSKNMILKAEANKTSCFVGEPVIATYKLYTRLQSESMLTKNPSFNGFSVIDIVQRVNQSANTHENLNGRDFNVYEIRKAQLYPLLAGDATIETATLDNKITFVKYDNTTGNNAFNETVILTSKPISIKVKPLPEAGKPTNFTGAVGNFQIEAVVEKNSFSTDETGKLQITISGNGNMQLLTAPEVQWGKGFEAFEVKATEDIDNTTVPISGRKTFEIPFVVTDTGTQLIAPISFSFFDPSTASYKMVSSSSIKLTISKGDGKTVNSILVNEKKKDTSYFTYFFQHRWIIIFSIAAIFLLSILFWVYNDQKKIKKEIEKEIKENEVIIKKNTVVIDYKKNYLEKTEHCLNKEDCNDFYTNINDELKTFFAIRLGANKENINSKTIATEMDNAGLDNNNSLLAQALFRDIEWQLYTPYERSEKMNETYATAQTLIQQMSKPLV
jgi:hypothetical protein